MPSEFVVHTQITGRAVTLVPHGELDLVSSPALKAALGELGALDVDLVVVDLREVEFMDSTGLHQLLQGQQQAHDLGRDFALIRGPEQVQRLFDLTGLADSLRIVASPDELHDMDQAPGAA